MAGGVGGTGQLPRDLVPPLPPPNPSGVPPPANGPRRRVVRVTNPLGLHQRAADHFHRAARKYTCAVTLWNGDYRADGKNLWDLIALAVLPGTEVVLEVEGPDADAAIDPLAEILGAPAGEDYTI